MRKLDFYWTTNDDWWTLKNGVMVIKPDAPKEAQESYKHFLEQAKSKRGIS